MTHFFGRIFPTRHKFDYRTGKQRRIWDVQTRQNVRIVARIRLQCIVCAQDVHETWLHVPRLALTLFSRIQRFGKGKGRHITGHQRPQRGSRGIALLILNLGARRGWAVSTTPRPLYPRERHGTHCKGGWVGRRAGLDVCEKSRLTPEFDPRTVQPVPSRYIDWATLPMKMIWYPLNTVCPQRYVTEWS
jgi:hypothetical protein